MYLMKNCSYVIGDVHISLVEAGIPVPGRHKPTECY